MGLHPSANEAPDLVQCARRMFVAAPIHKLQISESKQEPKFLNPQICVLQMLSRFNQRLQYVSAVVAMRSPNVILNPLGNFSTTGSSQETNW